MRVHAQPHRRSSSEVCGHRPSARHAYFARACRPAWYLVASSGRKRQLVVIVVANSGCKVPLVSKGVMRISCCPSGPAVTASATFTTVIAWLSLFTTQHFTGKAIAFPMAGQASSSGLGRKESGWPAAAKRFAGGVSMSARSERSWSRAAASCLTMSLAMLSIRLPRPSIFPFSA